MKKVMFILIAVICYLNGCGQSNVIIPLGNSVLSKNSFSFAERAFSANHMTLSLQSPTRGSFLEGQGDFSLMATVDASNNGTIKEVSFLCGAMYWMGLEEELSTIDYKLIKSGKTTLGNGASVPQKIYSNGVKRCYVRTLDNSMLQILFKRQVTQSKKK